MVSTKLLDSTRYRDSVIDLVIHELVWNSTLHEHHAIQYFVVVIVTNILYLETVASTFPTVPSICTRCILSYSLPHALPLPPTLPLDTMLCLNCNSSDCVVDYSVIAIVDSSDSSLSLSDLTDDILRNLEYFESYVDSDPQWKEELRTSDSKKRNIGLWITFFLHSCIT